MTSLNKWKWRNKSKREKQIKMAQYEWPKLPILHLVDSKRLTWIASTVQWRLPFCIALCSVNLFGSVVEYGLALDFDDVKGYENRRVRKDRGYLTQWNNYNVWQWDHGIQIENPKCWTGGGHNAKGNSHQVDSLQSNNLFLSQPQQQGKNSVNTYCSQREQRHCVQNIAYNRSCDYYVATNVPMLKNAQ